MVVVKIQNGTDIRRVNLDDAFTFNTLLELATTLFPELRKPFVFKYKDDEGDLVGI